MIVIVVVCAHRSISTGLSKDDLIAAVPVFGVCIINLAKFGHVATAVAWYGFIIAIDDLAASRGVDLTA